MAQHVYGELEASIASIVQAGSVFEIRLLHGQRKRVDAGYFNSPALAADALVGLQEPYQGIYLTPNPVAPDLLARAANRINPWAATQTHDPEILRRSWLLIDCDPVRPTGISATDNEHDLAVSRARRIAGMLEFQYGWCEPMINSSGNGAHILFPVNLPNTNEIRDLVAKFLKCLGKRFSDADVEVDTTVFNAARIWRVPGTWARKGDSVADRPHRKAAILQPIKHLRIVRLEQVERFVAEHEYLLTGAPKPVTSDAIPLLDQEARYSNINNHAMRRLKEWVPILFPDAREYKEGYRVSSADLGRLFEEDLTFHPWPLGIKDFGPADQGDKREGRRTPVQVVAEHVTEGDKDAAARKLADTLGVAISEFSELTPALRGGPDTLPGTSSPRALFDFGAIRNMAELRKRDFRKQSFIIPNFLPTGNIMLSSRPKMRKTWLALQLALAIVRGGTFLGYQCIKGDVLFLALEDNERRLRNRMDTLLTFDICPPDLTGFRYWTGGVSTHANGKQYISDPEEHARTLAMFPRGEAGVDAIDQFFDRYPDTMAVFIDTYAHFRDRSVERDIYQRDYEQMMPITRLAGRRDKLIMPVHHNKKGRVDQDNGDWQEDISGSSGIGGGVDGFMSIQGRRGVQEENESRKLLLGGRDVPEDVEIDMTFDAQRGGWLPAARQDVKLAMRQFFDRHPYITLQDFKTGLLPNVSHARISRCLTELKFEQYIVSTKFGYAKNPNA